MHLSSIIVVSVVLSCTISTVFSCTMICGNYWEGIHLRSYASVHAPIIGGLFKDQCFRQTGGPYHAEGHTWKSIQYGTLTAWLAAEYTYSHGC